MNEDNNDKFSGFKSKNRYIRLYPFQLYRSVSFFIKFRKFIKSINKQLFNFSMHNMDAGLYPKKKVAYIIETGTIL